MGFLCVLKGTIYGYLYCENEGLERLLDDVGFIPHLNLMQNNYISYASKTLPACVGLCLRT